MPGEGNAIQHQINKLNEQLKTATDPAVIAKLTDAIKDLKEQLQQGRS
jgi:hypothetical protein